MPSVRVNETGRKTSGGEGKLQIHVVGPNNVALPELAYLQRIDPGRTDGDNIADYNDYSELRAYYWVWKNELPHGHVGFFQFRRYLDLSGEKRVRPYYVRKKPTVKDFAAAADFLRFDIVAPMPEYTGESVTDRYACKHRAEDLALIRKIICEDFSEYRQVADAYLNGEYEYYCNLFLMRAELFSAYCEWLFDILERFTARSSEITPRVHGYLAERLFGIWFTKIKDEGRLNCVEVPRLHFWCYDDSTHHYKAEICRDLLLPPGSRMRAVLRKGYRKLKD